MGNSSTKNTEKIKLMTKQNITRAFRELSNGKDTVNFNEFEVILRK